MNGRHSGKCLTYDQRGTLANAGNDQAQRHQRWRPAVGTVVALLLCCSVPAAHSAAPSELLAKLPPIGAAALSPNGEQAVVLRAIGDTYHATLMDFESQKSRLLMSADPEQFLFNWCRFANSTRIVCSIRSYIQLRSNTGDVYRDGRTVATRLLAVDTDGGNVLQLIRTKSTRLGGKRQWVAPRQDQVVSWLPDDPDHIMISLPRDHRTNPSVYKLNIYDNKMKRVQRHHTNVFQWQATPEGTLKHGLGYDPAGDAYAYAVTAKGLRRMDLSGLAGATDPQLVGYNQDGKGTYVIANNGHNTKGLYLVNSQSGLVERTLLQHPDFDVGAVTLANAERRPLAVRIPGQRRYHFFDDAIRTTYSALKDAIPGKPSNLQLLALSGDDNRLILRASGNRTTPAVYLYDRATRSLKLIASSYPGLRPATIAEHQAVQYEARDGLTIPAYLTLPPKVLGTARKPLPTVVLPHGGPYARDNGHFDYWAQLLANEGYVVLQPNFRGSTGHGDEFLTAGYQQWGLSMQDDLDDGLAWLIKEGYTDPKRVCMVGGSYGGYAALVAAFKGNGRYRCSVAFAGVSDLEGQVQRFRSFGNTTDAIRRIQRGPARAANSPLRQVAKIDLPLLLVHGDVDRSVMIEQSRRLVAELTAAKKTFTYIEQANGDHFLSLQKHRTDFLQAMQKFLAEHLKS